MSRYPADAVPLRRCDRKNGTAFGRGILELAHYPDEYIGVDDMIDHAEVIGAAHKAAWRPAQD